MPGGPDWSTVWHQVTRNHANNAIIENGVMTTDLPPEILNSDRTVVRTSRSTTDTRHSARISLRNS